MPKIVIPRCSRRNCCRKSTSTCLQCGQRHCHFHHARNTDWGVQRIGEDEFVIPFEHWCFMVCWACASRANEYENWEEFVKTRKYLLRWIEDDEMKKKAWEAYKKVHELTPIHYTPHAKFFFKELSTTE